MDKIGKTKCTCDKDICIFKSLIKNGSFNEINRGIPDGYTWEHINESQILDCSRDKSVDRQDVDVLVHCFRNNYTTPLSANPIAQI